MGKYLDLLECSERYDLNDLNGKTPSNACTRSEYYNRRSEVGRKCRFGRILSELERRCPDHIELPDWQQAVEDGRRFLAQWGKQAAALGWTAGDLFGLQPVPDKPAPSYRRLGRYDATGLCWLLRGRLVAALAEDTAAIKAATGAITVYRRHNKPALGPEGDSLGEME